MYICTPLCIMLLSLKLAYTRYHQVCSIYNIILLRQQWSAKYTARKLWEQAPFLGNPVDYSICLAVSFQWQLSFAATTV